MVSCLERLYNPHFSFVFFAFCIYLNILYWVLKAELCHRFQLCISGLLRTCCIPSAVSGLMSGVAVVSHTTCVDLHCSLELDGSWSCKAAICLFFCSFHIFKPIFSIPLLWPPHLSCLNFDGIMMVPMVPNH